MALRDTLRNLIGIPDNDYDSDFDDDMQSGNVEQEEEEQQMFGFADEILTALRYTRDAGSV